MKSYSVFLTLGGAAAGVVGLLHFNTFTIAAHLERKQSVGIRVTQLKGHVILHTDR